MKKIILLIVVVIAIAAAYYAYQLYEKPVAHLTNIEADYVLSAETVFTEFELDEAAANEKYLGKILELSGVVKEKLSDEAGMTIILESGNEIFGINCGLNVSEEADFNKYQNGDIITLKGECAGYTMDVVLTRCVVIKE